MITQNYTKNTIDNTYRQYNGGYITYFKLLIQLFSKESIKTIKSLTFFQKIGFFIQIFFQFLFKPLLWVVQTKTFYTGSYEMIDDNISNHNLKKKKIYFFLRFLPFFYYSTNKIKNKDWERILN